MNATIRLVISASSLPPTSGRGARSSGPGSLIADLVVLCCLCCSLVWVLRRLSLCAGSGRTAQRQRFLGTRIRPLRPLAFGWDRSSVGWVEVWLPRPRAGQPGISAQQQALSRDIHSECRSARRHLTHVLYRGAE